MSYVAAMKILLIALSILLLFFIFIINIAYVFAKVYTKRLQAITYFALQSAIFLWSLYRGLSRYL